MLRLIIKTGEMLRSKGTHYCPKTAKAPRWASWQWFRLLFSFAVGITAADLLGICYLLPQGNKTTMPCLAFVYSMCQIVRLRKNIFCILLQSNSSGYGYAWFLMTVHQPVKDELAALYSELRIAARMWIGSRVWTMQYYHNYASWKNMETQGHPSYQSLPSLAMVGISTSEMISRNSPTAAQNVH